MQLKDELIYHEILSIYMCHQVRVKSNQSLINGANYSSLVRLIEFRKLSELAILIHFFSFLLLLYSLVELENGNFLGFYRHRVFMGGNRYLLPSQDLNCFFFSHGQLVFFFFFSHTNTHLFSAKIIKSGL